MGAYMDRLMRFHRPFGMSCSHWRCLIKQRVAFANRRNCACESGCHPEQNEGKHCMLTEFAIPPGYFQQTRMGEEVKS